MKQFSIVSLFDHSEYLDICAAWNLGYWSILNPKREPTFARSYEAFATNLKKDDIPLTLLAIDTAIDKPVGMISLWTKDSDHWKNETPWLASLFVHELYRGKNVANLLIKDLENKAKALNVPYLYLTAIEKVKPFYIKLGYEQTDQRDAPDKDGGIEYLLRKKLT